MVSTRRTAHQEPAVELDMDLSTTTTLKKKPVRKATAKKAEPAPAKPRTTRGKKVEPTPEIYEDSDHEDEQSIAQTKPKRKAAGRPKKNATAETEAPAPTITAKPTRSTRTTKRIPVELDEAPELPAPTETKPARRTRQTKAAPLSPKKNTQINKTQTRGAKTADEKPAKRVTRAKAPPKVTRSTRQQSVTDENADMPDLSPPMEEEVEIVMACSSPMRRASPTKRVHLVDTTTVEEEDEPMSSRPTTPTDSPRSNGHTDEADEEQEDETEEAIHSGDDAEDDANSSEDELCGPKTPMKRSSPTAHARYMASVQKTLRREVPSQTPPRRTERIGNTPQTQKVVSRPSLPTSERRPLTVARGGDRAFVFKDLQPIDDQEEDEEEDFTESEVNDTFAATEVDGDVEASMASIDDSFAIDGNEPDVAPPVPEETEEDQDETVVIQDEIEEGTPTPVVQPMESFDESENSVLITPGLPEEPQELDQMDCDVSEEEEAEMAPSENQSPVVETMIWDNLRQDVTIPIDFDAYMKDARMPAPVEPTERLSIAMAFDHEQPSTSEQSNSTEAESEASVETAQASPFSGLLLSAPAQPARRETLNATFNFNDFLDVSAFSESTQKIQTPKGPSLDDLVLQDESTMEATPTPSTPAAVDQLMEEAVETEDELSMSMTPHYALPTMAFDARRKSLPAFSMRTPVKSAGRPNTSDGASMPRIVNPMGQPWWTKAQSQHGTPVRPRSNTMEGAPASIKVKTPSRLSLAPSVAATPVATPKERQPRLSERKFNGEHGKTVAMVSRFRTPTQVIPSKRPATVQKAPVDAATPRASALRPAFRTLSPRKSLAGTPIISQMRSPARSPVRKTPKTATPAKAATPMKTATPRSSLKDRFRSLSPRKDFAAHAQTVAGPTRFRTPSMSPARRPRTVQKAGTVRKMVAFQALTPQKNSRTPIKTPLKPPAMTPSQVPMTPQPGAPLRGVTALVEVFTLDGASASGPFIALLNRLGARTTKTWSDRVTHVVFKDGSPATLQRVRLHNKGVDEAASDSSHIHCVNSRWVSECDTAGSKMDETDERFAVDVSEIPRGGKRRRKSMEPSALVNIGGNIVRDRGSMGRRSSLGRKSLLVKTPSTMSPQKKMATPMPMDFGDENCPDDSPETPAWLHPESLVQHTAPMNRIRKLELKGAANNRRLTFWNGTTN